MSWHCRAPPRCGAAPGQQGRGQRHASAAAMRVVPQGQAAHDCTRLQGVLRSAKQAGVSRNVGLVQTAPHMGTVRVHAGQWQRSPCRARCMFVHAETASGTHYSKCTASQERRASRAPLQPPRATRAVACPARSELKNRCLYVQKPAASRASGQQPRRLVSFTNAPPGPPPRLPVRRGGPAAANLDPGGPREPPHISRVVSTSRRVTT